MHFIVSVYPVVSYGQHYAYSELCTLSVYLRCSLENSFLIKTFQNLMRDDLMCMWSYRMAKGMVILLIACLSLINFKLPNFRPYANLHFGYGLYSGNYNISWVITWKYLYLGQSLTILDGTGPILKLLRIPTTHNILRRPRVCLCL